ncbi:MAG: peptidylprolyl isomerase [Wenzhouxiangella sp.]
MNIHRIALLIVVLFAYGMAHADAPRVWLDTDKGPILLELEPEFAPDHVSNFLAYVNDGFYDGLAFHRSIADFVIQSGGFDAEFRFRAPTRGPITGRPNNGLLHERGTLSMAQGADINSARSQFFINIGRNDNLDESFTVFGRVVAGMGVVDAINQQASSIKFTEAGRFDDAPVRPTLIRRAVETRGFPIMPLHSGSWFDPATAGTGFNIEISQDASTESGPLLVVYWYDFRDGQKIWASGVAPFAFGASEVTVELLAADDLSEADFRNPPPSDSFETWGSLSVRFTDCRRALFSYDTVAQGSGQIEAIRLTLPDNTSCDLLDD